MPLINRCGGGSSFAAVIQVTYTAGGVCTCQNGSTTLTAPDTSGSVNFKVKRAGTWVVTLTYAGLTATENVLITTDGESQHITIKVGNVYGIRRNIESTSPAWARTDDAVGFTATASVGTVAGSSSFDTCYPWNGITRQTLSTGDVMVKIPKFWYKRYVEGDYEYIKIADKALPGFKLHPAFNHANTPSDCVYVGAYKGYLLADPATSVSGQGLGSNYAKVSAIRSKATKKGAGWHLIDISTVSAIQMLIIVEFATNDVRSAIGYGVRYISDNSRESTGSCDNVPNLTGVVSTDRRKKYDVVWRGIEGFWGNCNEPVEGLYVSLSLTSSPINSPITIKYYVCNNPAYYGDSTLNTAHYTLLSYTLYRDKVGAGEHYIQKMGCDSDEAYAMLPVADVSDVGAYCDSIDYSYSYSGNIVRGGMDCGLFKFFFTDNVHSSRLMYIP